jgi:hypothetical protein
MLTLFKLSFLFEIYYEDSSKTISAFHEVLNFNHLFLKLNRLICNWHWIQVFLKVHPISLSLSLSLHGVL